MSTALLSLALASALAAPFDSPATELRYSGTLSQVGRDGAETSAKRFDLYCLVFKGGDDVRRVAFLVDEQGEGWPWPERFGVVDLDENNRPSGKPQPQLLQNHDGVLNPVALRLPIFDEAAKLKEGAEWVDGKLSYAVRRKKKVQDYNCWQVEVATNFGRAQTLSIDASSGLLVTVDQKLFMGRGDQYALRMELAGVKPVDAESLSRLKRPLDALLALKTKLNRSENETKPELTPTQLAVAVAAAPMLEKDAADTPFSRLASVIAKDVKSQTQRAGDVESLAKKFVGEKAPEFILTGLNGTALETDGLKGKVVVLHFFKYHAEPLTEPYGQVGYLDFLHNSANGKRKLGIQVYGVAVDERFGDPAQATAAARTTRRFVETMNLGYPVTSDDGSLLEKFGDPRRVGAKLPLWVVIGHDGKIAHYKAGFYDIKPDEGLKELDEVVIALVRKQRAAKVD